ncbi:MAG: hypothetical protein HWN67_09105 [Candidatus Helarchaeota archaeon]|nr:hypothetical protein [Candidatus Helarchaeota archaeon]
MKQKKFKTKKQIKTTITFNSEEERNEIVKFAQEKYGSLSNFVRSTIKREIAGEITNPDEEIKILREEINNLTVQLELWRNQQLKDMEKLATEIRIRNIKNSQEDQDKEGARKKYFSGGNK